MDQQSFIYKFLLAPQFRLWRYVALITFFTIVSLNQALVGYKDVIPLMGNNVYWVIAVTILVYIITVFLVSKRIVKYLLSGKYIQFVICVILCAFLFLTIPNITYDTYVDGYDLLSESVLVDNLSAFVIYLLCISGVFIPIFLRNWMISNQNLNELKIKQETSQVEQFKEQINPTSFFKVLGKSRTFVKTDPDRASAMLMKLGQLLRYQLYDCNRAQVLLTSEISFLRNFLDLEKLHSSEFDYTLNTTGNITGTFIPPSVLLPYVQNVINAFNGEEIKRIEVQINNSDDTILVLLKIPTTNNTFSLQKELLKMRERLDALYKNNYKLTINENRYIGNIEVTLELNK